MSNKTVVISQPRYIPAINYFHRMLLTDIFIYLDTVQYTPRDWENRNKIVMNKKPAWLSVPVIHEYQSQPIKDILIDNSQNWGHKHLSTLSFVYRKTPYFSEHKEFLEYTYSTQWNKLIDLNTHIIKYACGLFNIKCQFKLASDLVATNHGENLLIQLCEQVDAKIYISGPLGRNYINEENWNIKGIKVAYHDYHFPTYQQSDNETFIPWLSFWDLIFNEGPKSIEIMQHGNLNRIDFNEMAEM